MSSLGTTSTTRPAAQGDPSCATPPHFPPPTSSPSLHFYFGEFSILSSGSLLTGEDHPPLPHPVFILVLMCSAYQTKQKPKKTLQTLAYLGFGEVGTGLNLASTESLEMRVGSNEQVQTANSDPRFSLPQVWVSGPHLPDQGARGTESQGYHR